jgi:hypothetical protein
MYNGVDENMAGTCSELIFAPIDASFSDDSPLLPSGFRIIPIDAPLVSPHQSLRDSAIDELRLIRLPLQTHVMSGHVQPQVHAGPCLHPRSRNSQKQDKRERRPWNCRRRLCRLQGRDDDRVPVCLREPSAGQRRSHGEAVRAEHRRVGPEDRAGALLRAPGRPSWQRRQPRCSCCWSGGSHACKMDLPELQVCGLSLSMYPDRTPSLRSRYLDLCCCCLLACLCRFHFGAELIKSADGSGCGEAVLKTLWHHAGAILCCSLKVRCSIALHHSKTLLACGVGTGK